MIDATVSPTPVEDLLARARAYIPTRPSLLFFLPADEATIYQQVDASTER